MTYLVTVEISAYETRAILEKFTQGAYDLVRQNYGWMELPEKQEEVKDWWHGGEQMVDEYEWKALVDMGFNFKTKRVKGLGNSPTTNPSNAAAVAFTQISVANVGLFNVNSLKLMEDACTDAVQGFLDDGWRIIAVCPPNDTRRPTYILGKTEKL